MRKVICALAELIERFGESSRLSVTTFGSSINAVFGAVSGVVVDVTQSGAAPIALLATQPAGRAGAVTESKFSVNVPHGVVEGAAVAVVDMDRGRAEKVASAITSYETAVKLNPKKTADQKSEAEDATKAIAELRKK